MVKKLLGNKRGEMYVWAIVIILVLSVVFTTVLYYTMAITQVTGQRKGAMQVLDHYTQTNATAILNSIKMQHDKTETLSPDTYIESLSLAQGLTDDDGVLVATADSGTVRYRISDMTLSFTVDKTTKIHASYTLTIPLSFLGDVYWVDVPITITSKLNPKFLVNDELDQLVVTAKGYSGLYDGEAHGITVTCEPADVDVHYGMSADEVTSTSSPTFSEPGIYSVYYKAEKTGYAPVTGSCMVVIAAAPEEELLPLDVTVEGFSGIYDGSAHSITVTCQQEGATIMYGPSESEISMTTNPTFTNVGTYTVYYMVEKEGYATVTGSATVEITRASIPVPTQSGLLIYNGSAQSPSWNNYDSSKMTLGGVTSAVDAGEYIAIFTPNENYQWEDGTMTTQNVQWSIEELPMLAAGSTWFTQGGTSVTRSSIANIHIVKSLDDYDMTGLTITDQWDATAFSTGEDDDEGQVTAYVLSDNTLVLAGDGSDCIYANSDSTWLFSDPNKTDYFSSLQTINGADLLNMNTASTLEKAFNNCTALTSVDVGNWDTSGVTQMAAVFQNCHSLTTLDVGEWDLSNVTTLQNMFYKCTSIDGLDVSKWNTSSVTTMRSMFYACSSLKGLNLSNWNTANVLDMSYLFYKCTSIDGLDVSRWNTSSVTTMRSMFYCCVSLKTLDLTDWDVSNVTTMQGMFSGYTTSGAMTLTTIGDTSNWDTSSVTSMRTMFQMCPALETLNVSNWDVGNVTDFGYWFNSASNTIDNSVAELDVSKWDVSSAKDMRFMFFGCAVPTEIDVSNWDVSNVTTMNHMFSNCKNLESIDITKWDTSLVTSFNAMFNECESLTTIDVSGLETSKCTDIAQMFEYCTNLKSIVGLDKWDTSSITILHETFHSCPSLETLDISPWDTSKVTNFIGAFSGCSSLKELDLSGWDTSSAKYAVTMFKDCSSLEKIYVSDLWDMSSLVDDYVTIESESFHAQQSMFRNCVKLVGSAGTAYASDHIDYSVEYPIDSGYAHIDSVDNPGYLSLKNADIPAQSGTLTYNGSAQSPSWNSNYDASKMTLTGVTSGINAGEYIATFTLADGYQWSDGTTDAKEITWTIGKATGKITLSATSGTVTYPTAGSFTATVNSGVTPNISSDKTEVATATFVDGKVTVTPGTTAGTATITLSVSETTNYTAATAAYTVTVKNGTLAYTANGYNGAYDGNAHGITVSCSGATITYGTASGNETLDSSPTYTDVGTYTVYYKIVKAGYETVTGSATVEITRASIPVPTQSGSLTYNGNEQSPSWNNYDSSKMTLGGVTSAVDAGKYIATFTPNENYQWEDGTMTTQNVQWSIEELPMLAAGSTWFTQGGTSVTRSSIANIHIVKSLDDYDMTGLTITDQWDATAFSTGEDDDEGQVTAYVLSDNTLVLAGDGSDCIYANSDSTWLFSDQNKTDYFSSLQTITGAELLNMNTATTLGRAFYNCSSLTSVDVSNWDVSNVSDMSYLFYKCTSLDGLDVSKWDTSSVTTMRALFYCCISLKELDLTDWDVSNVESMQSMFAGHSSTGTMALTTIGDTSQWDTSSVTTMRAMFQRCRSLKVLDVSNWDVSNVTDFSGWFTSGSNTADNAITKLDVSKWDVSSVSSMASMFFGCGSLTELDVSKWDVSNVSNLTLMFSNCRSLESLDLSEWDTALVTSFNSMFNECESLTTIDVSGLETAQCTSFVEMFEYCYNLKNIVGLDEWNTSSATSFSEMFHRCTSLESLNISSWDTSKAKDCMRMFASCSSLKELDLSGWDTSSVELPLQMFSGCSDLERIYVSELWDMSNLIDDYATIEGGVRVHVQQDMFKNCVKLVGSAGTAYAADHVDYSAEYPIDSGYAHIDSVDNPGYLSVKIAEVPEQTGSLTYNGSVLYPSWNSNYDTSKMSMGGVISGTNAGEYTATFTLVNGYQWADGTTGPKEVTWIIGRANLPAPAQSGSLTYNGSDQSPSWNSNYDSNKMTLGGTTSGTNAGSYKATFTPGSNYQWSDGTTTTKEVTWTIGKASLTVPAQSGSLTYTGSAQSPSWNSSYDSNKMTLGGTTSGTNAGSYKATFTPESNYQWSDGTTTAKEVTWTIAKAAGKIKLSATSGSITFPYTGSFTATVNSGAALSVSSDKTGVATVTITDGQITVTPGATSGTATITVSAPATTNYTAATATYTANVTSGPVAILYEDGTFVVQNPGTLETGHGDIVTVYQGTNAWVTTDYTAANSVPWIKDGNYTKIKNVLFKDSLGYLSYWFYGCTNLETVIFEDSETYIGTNAFNGCTSLKSVELPDALTYLGPYAFANCSGLETVVAHDKLTSIPAYAFQNCTSLKSVTLGNKVTNIASYVFDGCTALPSITLPNTVTSIGAYAFRNCTSMESIQMSNSLKTLGYAAFYGCSKLKSIVLPDTLTAIPDLTFYQCSSLASATLSKNLVSIGSSAFRGAGLTSITIPASVTKIGARAFGSCSKLANVYFEDSATWYYTSTSGATSGGTIIDPADLAASATAATRLKTTYTTYYWYKVETEAPTLTVAAPSWSEQPTVTVSGTVTDPENDVKSVVVMVGGTEYAASISGNTWAADVTLASGVNEVEIVSTDMARNSTTETISLTYGHLSADADGGISGSIPPSSEPDTPEEIPEEELPEIIEFTGGKFETNNSYTPGTYVEVPYEVTYTEAVLPISHWKLVISRWAISEDSEGNIHAVEAAVMDLSYIEDFYGAYIVYDFDTSEYLEYDGVPGGSVKLFTAYDTDEATFENIVYLAAYTQKAGYENLLHIAKWNGTCYEAVDADADIADVTDFMKTFTVTRKKSVQVTAPASSTEHVFIPSGTLQAVKGMTWAEWLVSEYNTTGLTEPIIRDKDYNEVSYATVIVAGESYSFVDEVSYDAGTLLFTADGTAYFYGENNEVAATYTGWDQADYQGYDTPWYEDGNYESLTNVIIEDGVVFKSTIGLFADCHNLETAVIGYGMTRIDDGMFFWCGKLNTITIPDSVTYIGASAFENCTQLKGLIIPDSVLDIESSALYHCEGLETIIIGNGLTSIDNSLFYGCAGLTSVTIGTGVSKIGQYAFQDCTGLTSVIFEDTSTWYYTSRSSYTGGAKVTVTNASTAATYLKSTYASYYWYKS